MKRLVFLLLFLTGFLSAQPAKPGPGEIVPWQAQFQAINGDRWPWRAAQVQAESGFNTHAKSPVGAEGAVQAMPKTWRWGQGLGWVRPEDRPTDLLPSLVFQNRYMLWIAPRVGGDKDATTASYNCGLGNVQKAQRLARDLGLPGPGDWLQALPQVTGHHAKETQDYVMRIRRFELQIRARLEATR